jgi:hypothetical protein
MKSRIRSVFFCTLAAVLLMFIAAPTIAGELSSGRSGVHNAPHSAHSAPHYGGVVATPFPHVASPLSYYTPRYYQPPPVYYSSQGYYPQRPVTYYYPQQSIYFVQPQVYRPPLLVPRFPLSPANGACAQFADVPTAYYDCVATYARLTEEAAMLRRMR